MRSTLQDILMEELQKLKVPAEECERLRKLMKEIEATLKRYEPLQDSTNLELKQKLWERKLLDLSFRNSLINMKEGRRVVPFVQCSIFDIENQLADGQEIFIDPQLIDAKSVKEIQRLARTMMEESGANCLFLALGTLCYDNHQAPLLLVPIEIISANRGRFVMRRRDEQTTFNLPLVEFLHQNYDMELFSQGGGIESLPIVDQCVDVKMVVEMVRKAIAGLSGWQVNGDAHIGVFSFTKYVLWNDVHVNGTEFIRHPLLRSLVEGRLIMEGNGLDTIDAAQMERSVQPMEYALPVDCDSSQMEAVIASGKGHSFVLYGPPGTGKSQTITNIISNALFQGKRVLFVAQKKAALEVVEQRLAKIGLDPFCLELHSNKVNKQYFLGQLQQLIDYAQEHRENDEQFKKTSEQLFAHRNELLDFTESIHAKDDEGLSLNDYISRYNSLAVEEIHPEIVSSNAFLKISSVPKLPSLSEIKELCQLCLTIDAAERILGMAPSEHPLCGLNPLEGLKDLAKMVEQDLKVLPSVIDRAIQSVNSDLNIRYSHKTVRYYIENDYRWKHFAQIASPDPVLLDDVDSLVEAVKRWSANMDKLDKWLCYMQPIRTLEKRGYRKVLSMVRNGATGRQVADCIMKGWYRSRIEDQIQGNPILRQFNGMLFEQVLAEYSRLTREFQTLTQHELVYRLAERIPLKSKDPVLASELALLRKRIGNKGRGTSIRGIIDQIPHLLSSMCPCMLMSPLSVAQYIDIDTPKFDLVIFDEASQMPTSEALGAIARGSSVVIVGDPKQMPPTNFFASATTDEEQPDLDDLDSILDDCIALSMPSRHLVWHYRSLHESLIAFSNHHYYDGRLLTFPSADNRVSHVSWQYVPGVYDYGKTRTNRAEAEAVVAEVCRRLRNDERQSIGVVAFSKQQSDLIEDLLGDALTSSDTLRNYASTMKETLLVKNLENVQGDERDVILFSVGYGPDKDGKVSMNFGPLNKVGGERRLNVAVTRARSEMKVFSTLKPELIDEHRTSSAGVIGLKRFLEFAASGSLCKQDNGAQLCSNSITDMANTLRKKGYQVDEIVGASDIKVHLAIVDPTDHGRYCLGIICDMDNGTGGKTMRDKEIVRPVVLQHLGWAIMHVWMLEWFLNPESVIKEIERHIHPPVGGINLEHI